MCWVSGMQNCWKIIGFAMIFGLWKAELFENHWFYKVSGSPEKFLGLLKAELLKNHWFYMVSGSPECRIVGKPLVL